MGLTTMESQNSVESQTADMNLLIACMIIGLGESALIELPVFSGDNKSTDDGDIGNFGGGFDSSFHGDENKGHQHVQFLSNREYLPVGDPSSSYDAKSLQYEGSVPYLPPSTTTGTTTSTTTTIFTSPRASSLPPESKALIEGFALRKIAFSGDMTFTEFHPNPEAITNIDNPFNKNIKLQLKK